ncbi:DUF5819 family protein [Sphingobacterium anhuiense]|uniref:DUF5819 family protein n=1 Tax=Sphingobacterium anhuiense TaxID=493780 RepID=A0ABW5YZJ5_9SPHI
MKKASFFIIRIALIIHLSIIGLYLSQNYIKGIINPKFSNKYVEPIFEQNWGMFSNVPTGNINCLIRFSNKTDTTSWYNITTPLYERNAFLLSIDQRLSKYLDGVSNEIIAKHSTAIINSKDIKDSTKRVTYIDNYIKNSFCFKSLINYSKNIYYTTTKHKENSDKVQIMFIYEPIQPYDKREKAYSEEVKQIILPPTYLFK